MDTADRVDEQPVMQCLLHQTLSEDEALLRHIVTVEATDDEDSQLTQVMSVRSMDHQVPRLILPPFNRRADRIEFEAQIIAQQQYIMDWLLQVNHPTLSNLSDSQVQHLSDINRA